MTALPASIDFTDSSVTEANFKTAITNQRDFLAGLLGADGVNSTALQTLGALGNNTVAKSSNYTVIDTDRGVVFVCTGTFTLSLAAAATLADGFTFAVINAGAGIVTIDPNSTEQIDGANTKDIAAGSWAIVSCTGAAFYSMGAVPATGALIGYQVFTSSGTYTKSTNNPSFVIVEVVGGGGSGGTGGTGSGIPAPTYYGGAGGGGGYAREKLLASALASSETVTVGGAAGTSSFGSHCSATGGVTGGTASAFGPGANSAGGTGSGGDINRSGARGNTGFVGGNSALGFGGSAESKNGIAYGGGATGGLGAGVAGGIGASGIVIIWEYK